MLIDPVDVERVAAATVAGGGRVSAIIAVHLAGEVADMKALRDVARRYDAVLVEDAAHAFPSRTAAGYAGTLGDVGVFSFYANKTITTGEGGMLVTADAAIAERVRTMRLHGIDREAWDRYSDPRGEILSLPLYPDISPAEQHTVADTVVRVIRDGIREGVK
jgi:dTDP-4-amino-4,6-dideoxygalactose transaminase